jgi:hypothetical protein
MENNQLKHQQINSINFYLIDIYKINEIFNANSYLYLYPCYLYLFFIFIFIIIVFNFKTNT